MLCSHCKDTIKQGARVKLKDKTNHTQFTIDIGCAFLLEYRGVIEIKGQEYKLIYI